MEQAQPRGSGVAPAFLVSLAIVLSTLIAAGVFYKSKSLSDALSVTGSADRTIVSDVIKWTASFSRTADPDALVGGNEAMASDLKTVLAYLKSRGVAETDVKVQPMTVAMICDAQGSFSYDKFGNQTCGANRAAGYTLQQSIVVESSDVEKLGKVTEEATGKLVAQGILFTSQNVEYYYSKLADLKLDLLDDATRNAKDRADRIARSTGKRLGELRDASMGVFQVTAVNSSDISDYGAYDTSSIDKKMTAVVKASFSLR